MKNFKFHAIGKQKNFWLSFLIAIAVIVVSMIIFSSTLHIYLVDSFFERNMHGIARVPKYIKERYEIICATKQKALQQMQDLKQQLDLLDYKEQFYQNLIKNDLEDIWNPMNKISPKDKVV